MEATSNIQLDGGTKPGRYKDTTVPSSESPATGVDLASPLRKSASSTPTHIAVLKSDRTVVDPVHPSEMVRAAGLRNRILAAHAEPLPLDFAFAPAHH